MNELSERVVELAQRGCSHATISVATGLTVYQVRYITEPQKIRAQQLFRRACFRGEIERPNECSKCGAEGDIQGHHHDYSKPFDVEWLCVRCHAAAHTGEYRTTALSPGLTYREEHAIWFVGMARGLDREDLLGTHSLAEIVSIYDGFAGIGPRRHRTLAEVDAGSIETVEAA